MTQTNTPTSEIAWERDPRFSALPVKDVLKIRMKDLGVKNVDLQRALGYPAANVIAMMKMGTMRLPANKVIDAARVLQVDPVFLLGKVIAESDPDLWVVISKLLSAQLVSASELDLVNFVRRGLDGHDVNLTHLPDLTQLLALELKVILDRENALTLAAINRKDA